MIDIRQRAEAGAGTVALARLYGVHRNTIGKIRRGEKWTHVGEPFCSCGRPSNVTPCRVCVTNKLADEWAARCQAEGRKLAMVEPCNLIPHYCDACGKRIANGSPARHCRPCAMRALWSTPDYREAMSRRKTGGRPRK